MTLGQVAGAVWATRKSDALGAHKLLLVEPWSPKGRGDRPGETLWVCADLIGAGVGERVVVTTGGGARRAIGQADSPVDAAVVAIVDGWELP